MPGLPRKKHALAGAMLELPFDLRLAAGDLRPYGVQQVLRLPCAPGGAPAQAVLELPYHRELDAVCDADASSNACSDGNPRADA